MSDHGLVAEPSRDIDEMVDLLEQAYDGVQNASAAVVRQPAPKWVGQNIVLHNNQIGILVDDPEAQLA